jgi:threonine aldolase
MLKLSFIESVLPVDTNIIIFNLNTKIKPEDFVLKLASQNIKAVGFGKQAIRFVTHLDFTDDMLTKVEANLVQMDT